MKEGAGRRGFRSEKSGIAGWVGGKGAAVGWRGRIASAIRVPTAQGVESLGSKTLDERFLRQYDILLAYTLFLSPKFGSYQRLRQDGNT